MPQGWGSLISDITTSKHYFQGINTFHLAITHISLAVCWSRFHSAFYPCNLLPGPKNWILQSSTMPISILSARYTTTSPHLCTQMLCTTNVVEWGVKVLQPPFETQADTSSPYYTASQLDQSRCLIRYFRYPHQQNLFSIAASGVVQLRSFTSSPQRHFKS